MFTQHKVRRATLTLGGALLLGSLAMPATAQEVVTRARITRSLTLYAGPAVDYPQVQHLEPHTLLGIHGCLPDYDWCDVWADGQRGWIDTAQLRIDVRGQFRPLRIAGPIIGLPVVHFAIGPYWIEHYSGYPWFDDPRYVPSIQAYRVQSRIGNTVIEYEESRPIAQPSYRPPLYGGYYEPAPVHIPPPVYRPPVVQSPPPRFRPAPTPVHPGPPRYHHGGSHRPYGSGHLTHGRPSQIHRPPPTRPSPGHVRPDHTPPGNAHSGAGELPAYPPPSRIGDDPNPLRPNPINRDMPGGRALK
ncbi:MAG: hypothetical protein Q4A16_01490 [Lautropia sp.]|nr:hypothetical protein [Lautropia sp.]